MIVDLFAGPGGWSEGLRMLGHHELGIEWDPSAVETARAAGHARRLADVAALDPLEFAPCEGLIGSPPCPSFSAAGKRAGLGDVEHVVACALELAAGNDSRAEHRVLCEDERSMLSVEPLRWALALEPEWVALEQVPPVLPIWSLFAQVLEERGYGAWAGVLEAERYGVPQTRERAFLLARRDGAVHPPQATHQRYVPGEPQRHDFTLEGEVLPWVSMAEALGWGATARPYPTIACSSATGGPDMEKVGGSNARAAIYAEQEEGRWVQQEGAEEHPRPHLRFRATNARPNACERGQDEPAPTMAFGHERPVWVETRRGGDRINESTPVDVPSPTVTTRTDRWQLKGDDWPTNRPATTIAGDPRVFQPGGHHANDGRRSSPEDDGRSQHAIRVSIEEAGVLQSFRRDYPWQGNRSEQFRQVGNAVPPLLAAAVLACLIGEGER